MVDPTKTISAADLHAKIDRAFDNIRPLSDAVGWSDPFDFLIHETWKRDPKVEALREERDAAIADLEAAELECRAAVKERDALLVEMGESLGLLGNNGAPLTERVRQRDAEKKVTYDRAAGVKGPHILVHRQMWDQLREERDSAIRKGAAERAMLDEILALPDIEAPAGDGSENVASVVASALEALREERDAAIRERDLARAHDTQPYPTSEAYERVCAALEATKRSLEQTRAAMEAGDACTVCAGTGKPVSGKPCICGGHGGIRNQIIGLTREVQRERERANRAEALLAEALHQLEIAYRDWTGHIPVGWLHKTGEVLAKSREHLGDVK